MKNNDWRLASEVGFARGTDRITGTGYVRDIDFGQSDATSGRSTDDSGERVNPVSGLSEDRVEEIRRRIEDGTYLTESMAEQVARTLIARGDLSD